MHFKLSLALLITALQQKCMPGISEGFNYTHIISFRSRRRRRREKKGIICIDYRNYWNIVWQRNLAAQK